MNCAACGLSTRSSSQTMGQMRAWTGIIVVLGLGCAAGCGVSFAPLLPGSVAGRAGIYDYSPSVIKSGDLQQFWWCGAGINPTDVTQFSDTIEYESIDLTTNAHYGPLPVLAETQGGWDSVFTCNPKVVKGTFTNPLGSGENFTYAMYYVATGMP